MGKWQLKASKSIKASEYEKTNDLNNKNCSVFDEEELVFSKFNDVESNLGFTLSDRAYIKWSMSFMSTNEGFGFYPTIEEINIDGVVSVLLKDGTEEDRDLSIPVNLENVNINLIDSELDNGIVYLEFDSIDIYKDRIDVTFKK